MKTKKLGHSMRNSLLMAMAVFPFISYATTYSPPSADVLLRSKLCVVKKDLPESLSVSAHPKASLFQLQSSNNDLFRFYFKPELKKTFPSNMSKKHFPVLIFENGELLDNFYGEWRAGFNTIAMKESSGLSYFLGHSVETHWPYRKLDKKDLTNYLEIPLNYYFQGKFVKNKLQIYLRPVAPATVDNFIYPKMEVIRGMFQTEEVSRVKIDKILTLLPLPAMFKIELRRQDETLHPDVAQIVGRLNLTYTGKDPIFFVKEYDEDVFENEKFATGKIPDLIINNKKCFEYNAEFKFLASKEKHKPLYDTFYGQYESILEQLKKQDKSIKVADLINSLKEIDLYYTQPLGFEFPGNGLEKSECFIRNYGVSFSQNESNSKMVSATVPSTITIPPEEEKIIEVESNNKVSKVRFIKKYVINDRWEPLDKQDGEVASFNGAFGMPPQKKKERINYLKDVKLVKSKSQFREDELVCLNSERL